MRSYFNRSPIFDCDCFVADYTNMTDSQVGVKISTEPFSDIPYFHLKKRSQHQHLPYLAVNLEDYPQFIENTQNCECVFSAVREEGKKWLLLLETKYCAPDNIEMHAFKAYAQMSATLSKLEKLELAGRSRQRVYFAYSVPGQDEKSPFGSFAISQNETLKSLQEEGIHLLPYNTVVVATPEYLFPLPKNIYNSQ